MKRFPEPARVSGWGGHDGAAAVEFALLLPVFLMLVFGVIDFGLAINRQSQMNNAAREAAREGVFNPVATEITQLALDSLTGVPVDEVTVTVDCLRADGSDCVDGQFDTEAQPGGTVIVQLDYTNAFVTPAPALIGLGQDIDVRAEVRMRIE